MSYSLVSLRNISKSFDRDGVLFDINLDIKNGEFLTLLGPSGCGKTTLLRIIGGFEEPDDGEVFFDSEKINDIPPHKRKINTVFQKYALFPHLDVYENIAFGLKVSKAPAETIRPKVMSMLEMVNLKGFERRKVTQLSGGQQQRVAIARALINRPLLLLLDEPLGALDLKLRKEMQLELKKIQQQTGITFIYVTHDQEEALTMSDTVVVMKDGVIQQVGTPADVYNEPNNAFVADFIGESNIVDGTMLRDREAFFAGRAFECVDEGFGENTPVDVVIRPEDIRMSQKTENALLSGVVESVIFKGVHYESTVNCAGLKWLIHSTNREPVGSTVGLKFKPEDIHIMKRLFKSDRNVLLGEVSDEDTITFMNMSFTREKLRLKAGTTVELTINPEDMYVVSEDKSDLTVYLESLIYKGAYNELIVSTPDISLLLHSQNDEQVGTDIGIKFDFDKIMITPVAKVSEIKP